MVFFPGRFSPSGIFFWKFLAPGNFLWKFLAPENFFLEIFGSRNFSWKFLAPGILSENCWPPEAKSGYGAVLPHCPTGFEIFQPWQKSQHIRKNKTSSSPFATAIILREFSAKRRHLPIPLAFHAASLIICYFFIFGSVSFDQFFED